MPSSIDKFNEGRRVKMGYYINPKKMSKEAWLRENGTQMFIDNVLEQADFAKTFPVCLVDNGAFTAAGICYSENEFQRFIEPDGRMKYLFLCKVEDIMEVCPEFKG
jgi:hypothetical protein